MKTFTCQCCETECSESILADECSDLCLPCFRYHRGLEADGETQITSIDEWNEGWRNEYP